MTSPLSETYGALVADLKRLHALTTTQGLLGWDEQVNLPPASAPQRATEMATLADLIHREFTRPQVGTWLDLLEPERDSLRPEQKVVLDETRREYERATRLPPEFVQRRSIAQSQAFHAWREARQAGDFATFRPFLENVLALSLEEASYHGFAGNEAYDFFIDRHDPGLNQARIESLFDALEPGLKDLARRILESPAARSPAPALRGFPVDRQESFLRQVIAALGFDFQRGRIDSSVHPFCAGNARDTRLTTRFDPDNPLDSLSSAMHETGHGLYQQGLPEEHFGTAMGEPVGMAIHESQSRLWENQVGRSRAFWKHWEPRYRELFPQQLESLSSEDLYRTINRVALTPIRVDADEVTYNLHILLRFDLEKRLFRGSLAVPDLPEAWNEASTRILGYTPRDDREGCLQDVHWSGGAFGYFPSYCIGNMIAAQLWATVQRELPDLESCLARAEYAPLLAWMRERIHRHGRLHRTDPLVLQATGTPLNPSFLLEYLNERYGSLYLHT